MPWPVDNSWNQHLDELNSRLHSRAYQVSLVRIEKPFSHAVSHTRHVHPYWQMSVVIDKSFSVDFDGMHLEPEARDIMLIPARNWHYFHFPTGKKAWTIKFVLDGVEEKFPPGIMRRTEQSLMLNKWLQELMTQEIDSSRDMTVVLEHVVACALDLHFQELNVGGSDTNLIRRARIFIEDRLGDGVAVKAADVARSLGLSLTYLTRVFKRQLGIPLKVYIDQERFNVARKLMDLSDGNLSEIASELGFDDVFRFSRFFKRMSGVCPSEYRR